MIGEKRLAIFGIVSASCFGLICIAIIAAGGLFRGDLRASLGSLAPEIISRDIDNHALKLSGLRGKFVLIYFTPDLAPPSTAELSSNSTSPNFAAKNAAENAAKSSKIALTHSTDDFQQLDLLSRTLDAQQVTILEGRQDQLADPMDLISLVAQGSARNADGHRMTHMLYDADGDIARRFKVDSIASQSTLFVIDADGVIRFRGRCEQAAATIAGSSAATPSRQLSMRTSNATGTADAATLATLE